MNKDVWKYRELRFRLCGLQFRCVCDIPLPSTRPVLLNHFNLQALTSLARDIEQLEGDVTAPALSDASTDPAKACARLEGYRVRLLELQVSGGGV